MDDASEIRAILSGDTDRFGVLVDRYLGLVRGLCASHIGRDTAVDDLVQETFVAAFVGLPRLRRPERFAPWLCVLARNLCRTWVRARGRQHRAQARLEAQAPPSPPLDPLTSAAREELHAWLHNAVEALPSKTREAMHLCYVEGRSVAEAARFLNARESAIKKRLQYGRACVGERLWQEFGKGSERPADTADLRKRVLAALPVRGAPWAKAGSAVAATGGSSAAVGWAVAVPLIVVAGALALWWQPWRAETLVQPAAVSALLPESPVPTAPEPRPHAEAPAQAKSVGPAPQPAAPQVVPAAELKPTVSGRVYDEAGQPVAGAEIVSGDMGGTKTDAEGRYSLDHNGGRFELTATGGVGAWSKPVTLELGPEESAVQDFVVPNTARILLDIRKPDGSVPDEDEVILRRFGSDDGYSTGEPHREGDVYVAKGVPNEYTVDLMVRGHERVTLTGLVVPEELRDTTLEVRLKPTYERETLDVLVVDEQDRPVEGCTVWADLIVGEGEALDSSNSIPYGNAKTDAAGLCRFEGLGRRLHRVRVYKNEARAETEVAVPAPGPLRVALDLREPGAEFDLRILDAAGQPRELFACGVTVLPATGDVRFYTGQLSHRLPEGRNLVFVTQPGWTAAAFRIDVTHAQAASNQPTTLEARTSLEGGTIVGALERQGHGMFVSQQELYVFPLELWEQARQDTERPSQLWNLGRQLAHERRVEDDNTFAIAPLAAGDYVVALSAEEFAGPVHVEPGRPAAEVVVPQLPLKE